MLAAPGMHLHRGIQLSGCCCAQAPFWRGLSLITFHRYTTNIVATLQFENGCNLGIDTLKGRACQAVLDNNDFDISIAHSFVGLAAVLVAAHCLSVFFMLMFGRK